MNAINIFTDGSAKGNPGPGGFAGIVQNGDEEHIVKGNEPHTTNNRMEMRAIIEGIKKACEIRSGKDQLIVVVSDSRLIIETMNSNWKRKKNLDLWNDLDLLVKGLSIKWQWIKGHANHKENNRADEIAQAEAEKARH